MPAGALPPHAEEPLLTSHVDDLHVDQPQVLLRQLLPFGHEIVPVGVDPQVVGIVARQPDAGIQQRAVDVLHFNVHQPQTLRRQLLPLGDEVCLVRIDPQIVPAGALTPHAVEALDAVLAGNLHVHQAQVLLS